MKVTTRKILSLFLATIFIIALVPVNVLASAVDVALGHYEVFETIEYSLDENGEYKSQIVSTEKVWVPSNVLNVTVGTPNTGSSPDKSTWSSRNLLANCSNSSNLLAAYDTIYNAMAASGSNSICEINLSSYKLSTADALAAYDAYQSDHPEHFWRSPNYSMLTATNQGTGETYIYSLKIPIYYTGDTLTAAKSTFETATNNLLSGINDNMTEYEKEKYIYDTIQYHSTYDYDNMNISDTEGFYNAHSAYGIIVNGLGVCDSYARAFDYLLSKAGIESLYVTGTAGGSHAWNYVKIDGSWYCCDITWDDSWDESWTNIEEATFYSYFNITSAKMGEDHTPSLTSEYGKLYYSYLPTCTATTAAYYTMNADAGYDIVIDDSDLNENIYDDIAHYITNRLDDEIRLKCVADGDTVSTWIANNIYYITYSEFGSYPDLCSYYFCYDELILLIRWNNQIHGDISYDAVTKNNPTTVTLLDSESKVVATQICTKFDSSYCFSDIPDGTYTVKAEKGGCATKTYSVTVSSVKTDVNQDIKLLADNHIHTYENGYCTVCQELEPGITGANNRIFTDSYKSARCFGSSRYNTSFATANALKAALGVEKFDNMIIADGTGFADALAGSYLAAKLKAPIIMSNAKNGNDDTKGAKTYIANNYSGNGTIYILGGTSAVSETFENYLTSTYGASKVKRIAGDTRFETNIKILDTAGATGEDILICNGRNFADALSVSALGKPILLVDNKDGKIGLSTAQKNIIQNASNVYIIGGTGAVPTEYEALVNNLGKTCTRVAGNNRFDTSIVIANTFKSGFANKSAVVATGVDFPDGLCGGPLAYVLGAPLILTSDAKYSFAQTYVNNNGLKTIALGGENALANSTLKAINNNSIKTLTY